MKNTPMAIMWSNQDGSITLSPRETNDYVMPELDPTPRRSVYLSSESSAVCSTIRDAKRELTEPIQPNAAQPKFAFRTTVHAFNQPQFHLNQRQTFIYAFSTANPGSSSPSAPIVKHEAHGRLVLDLSKTISGTTSGSGTLPADRFVPYSKYEKLVLAHAVMCAVGFLVLLPMGALVARLARTCVGWWFTAHWVLQFAISEFNFFSV